LAKDFGVAEYQAAEKGTEGSNPDVPDETLDRKQINGTTSIHRRLPFLFGGQFITPSL
jgi:hypothetical protein